jgi:hypothetical protein
MEHITEPVGISWYLPTIDNPFESVYYEKKYEWKIVKNK